MDGWMDRKTDRQICIGEAPRVRKNNIQNISSSLPVSFDRQLSTGITKSCSKISPTLVSHIKTIIILRVWTPICTWTFKQECHTIPINSCESNSWALIFKCLKWTLHLKCHLPEAYCYQIRSLERQFWPPGFMYRCAQQAGNVKH